MKKTTLVVFLMMGNVGYCGTVASPYKVGTWSGFRTAAVSYTFDDDLPNQLSIAVPMFDANGFAGTLFTVTSPSWYSPANWPGLENAASLGFEIASHTMDHLDLPSLSDANQIYELSQSQTTINSYIPGNQCLTIAYPNCDEGTESLIAEYYIAGRTCSGQIVPATPSNFYQISCFILGNAGINTLSGIEAEDNAAVSSGGWCVFLIHAIDDDNGYSPLSSTILSQSVQYLAANRSTFWVGTFLNVVKYIKERNDVSVSETSNTGDTITVSVTGTLNTTIYNYPITIRRPLPAGWSSAIVEQNDQNVNSSVVTVGSTQYVMFDVVPNDGNVVLIKPPGAPANLTARAGYKKVLLNWDDSNDVNVAGYNVYRSTTSGSGFTKQNKSLLSSSDYNDNKIPRDANYYYAVTAVDVNSVESSYSDEASVYAVYDMTVQKCTVTAGKTYGYGGIVISGYMNADGNDFNDANYVRAIIDSNDIVSSYIQTFPVDGNSFKKGKFNYTVTENASSTSFKFDTKTHKFSFEAKNVDLSGFDCPLVGEFEIGDYDGAADINEAIVNGKNPIPINLLMGVANSLRVDKSKFTKKSGSVTQFTISGGFSVADLNDANMADTNCVVELAGQTFTIPKGSFTANKNGNKFTCSKSNVTGGVASAAFDFTKCTFTLTIKNTHFSAAAGPTELDIDFAGFDGVAKVSLP